jgi:uncharacterized protein (DUF1501 family)
MPTAPLSLLEAPLTRRQMLRGGFALGAFLLPQAAGAARTTARPRLARGTIFIMLEGGMSHLDSWDPKPNAPAEIRGEFGTIATTVAGLRIGEYLPRLARQAHRCNLIRSVHCDARNDHSPGMHLLLTGWENTNAGVALETTNRLHPAQGSVLARVLGCASPAGVPRFVALPRTRQISGQVRYAGPAFLGPGCEAFETGEAPAAARLPMQLPPSLALARDLPLSRLNDRQGLRQALDRLNATLDRAAAAGRMDAQYQRALHILSGQQMAGALDLQREPVALRERYGNHRVGQSLLLARRLVECGVRYVLVDPYGNNDWDTHTENFRGHKALLPPMDQAVAALLDDLDQRGLLDEVVVVLASEMGRSPRISGQAGRDHWTHAYSVMIAGGGLSRGQVLGETTSKGEWPGRRPVTVPEILATVYHRLGIDPNTILHDEQGRPVAILPEPRPIRELLG